MDGKVKIYYGEESNQSITALGYAMREVNNEKSVVLIQFPVKGNAFDKNYSKRLEPEIRLFTFEKSARQFRDLLEVEKQEISSNIRNGLKYAHKVLSTQECDVLILEEALELINEGIIETKELESLIRDKPEGMEIILTGVRLTEEVGKLADYVYEIRTN